ncbi:MAG TPA: FAD-binding oxidoreductase [Candidatus Hydrogenedentes bacterium]|nr:FAD-binding oxidoreductase [Candidatus Hydrogenedentota bacterium]
MSIDRRTLRWNGWGWLDAPDVLGEKADAIWAWMGRVMGVDPLPVTPPMPLAEIALPEPLLGAAGIKRLGELLAPERVMTDPYERAFHARGQSYHDLLHLRAGRVESAPDAVAYPVSTDECLALVQFAADEGIPLIPFGGGSSVVGGVTGAPGAVTVDMTLMDKLLDVDGDSLVARAQAGIYGPHLEDALQAQGFTLGHYPQSFQFSTLGGWIAPRSAGHQSNLYGTAEEWVRSATLATPEGLWTTEAFPNSAAGPQMRDIVAGSEGVLGIITEAEVRIHRVPEIKDYRAYVFAEFAAGVAALRAIMQSGVPHAMVRLSDADETFFYNALDSGGARPGETSQFCLMLVGIEGDATTVDHAREHTKAIVKEHGGMHMGEAPAEKWYATRFETPYLRDPIMDHGAGVDTLETCTRWANIVPLHDAVCKALADALEANGPNPGSKGIVMSHLSHSYKDGSSLYFIFAFPRALDREVAQWLAVKKAASDAIVAHGGTITHHHGIGTDHLPWFDAEKGPIGMAALRALKEKLDPTGILNPGKLLR